MWIIYTKYWFDIEFDDLLFIKSLTTVSIGTQFYLLSLIVNNVFDMPFRLRSVQIKRMRKILILITSVRVKIHLNL